MDELTPAQAAQLINKYLGRTYIQQDVGTDERTRWALNMYQLGSGRIGCVASCYQRVYTDNKWVLSVAGTCVGLEDINSDDGMVWECVADRYEDIHRRLSFQGVRDSKGKLICPELPGEGWWDEHD